MSHYKSKFIHDLQIALNSAPFPFRMRDTLLNMMLKGHIEAEISKRKDIELLTLVNYLKVRMEGQERNQSEIGDMALKLQELSQTLKSKWVVADIQENPGNCQEIASADFPDHRTDSDMCLIDANKCRNPKNAQALPKSGPSILVDNNDDMPNIVSIHQDELFEITRAWPMLSGDVRAGILAMVRTTSQRSNIS